MATGTVPSSLSCWFKANYPTLRFEPTWLEQCCAFLQDHFNLTNSQLIKKVETQLLLSDLATSTSPSDTPLPEALASDKPFQSFPKELILSNGSILLQIQSITEIAHSALALETAHEKRLDDAKGRDRVLGLDDEEGLDKRAPIHFPRAMLRLELSDGHRTVSAIEYQKIQPLELGTTPLGCKLLINNVKARRGLLLLTPQNTTLKGFQVDELEAQRDQVFQTGLDFRLRRPVNPPDQGHNADPPPNNALPNGSNQAPESSMITNTGLFGAHPASIVPQPNRNSQTSTFRNMSHRTSTLASITQAPSTTSNTFSAGVSREVVLIRDSDDEYDDGMDFEAEMLEHLP